MTNDTMNPSTFAAARKTLVGLAAAVGMTLLGGCAGLLPKGAPPPAVYLLEGVQATHEKPPAVAAAVRAPALLVNPTRAAPGFDSQHIVYVRVAHQLEHFAHSEWADTPARMLTPLIVSAIERTGAFAPPAHRPAVSPLNCGSTPKCCDCSRTSATHPAACA
ncbi:ABC-type transport auxiliary lipoprotein family protein [Variovorax sp. PAMC 28711]|uniref:ABC-type transport auxiliary lipoprotein family protein n=1 Tax=Variovorax sp. PAMC 28711 TaxID=1795631 RepID=UPI00078BF951|nr:ABC-type transport auxiliary lipoprotein family protein [Variovorax sp. PAMC 28711]AMM23537.1 hypothetical protein AX767_03610 [Variovorax sp. PAMC 28711]